jgi:transposase-like protein
MVSIAEKIGCSAHIPFEWAKKAEVDSGKPPVCRQTWRKS